MPTLLERVTALEEEIEQLKRDIDFKPAKEVSNTEDLHARVLLLAEGVDRLQQRMLNYETEREKDDVKTNRLEDHTRRIASLESQLSSVNGSRFGNKVKRLESRVTGIELQLGDRNGKKDL